MIPYRHADHNPKLRPLPGSYLGTQEQMQEALAELPNWKARQRFLRSIARTLRRGVPILFAHTRQGDLAKEV